MDTAIADRLPYLAEHWSLGPDDRVLSGTVPEVTGALDALGVARWRNDTWRLDGWWGDIGTLLAR